MDQVSRPHWRTNALQEQYLQCLRLTFSSPIFFPTQLSFTWFVLFFFSLSYLGNMVVTLLIHFFPYFFILDFLALLYSLPLSFFFLSPFLLCYRLLSVCAGAAGRERRELARHQPRWWPFSFLLSFFSLFLSLSLSLSLSGRLSLARSVYIFIFIEWLSAFHLIPLKLLVTRMQCHPISFFALYHSQCLSNTDRLFFNRLVPSIKKSSDQAR